MRGGEGGSGEWVNGVGLAERGAGETQKEGLGEGEEGGQVHGVGLAERGAGEIKQEGMYEGEEGWYTWLIVGVAQQAAIHTHRLLDECRICPGGRPEPLPALHPLAHTCSSTSAGVASSGVPRQSRREKKPVRGGGRAATMDRRTSGSSSCVRDDKCGQGVTRCGQSVGGGRAVTMGPVPVCGRRSGRMEV